MFRFKMVYDMYSRYQAVVTSLPLSGIDDKNLNMKNL